MVRMGFPGQTAIAADASNWVGALLAQGSINRSTLAMARRLRIQFGGARYHIINRGNLQHNVFITPGAIRWFEMALGQAASQYRWRVHAYVVMRNHTLLRMCIPSMNTRSQPEIETVICAELSTLIPLSRTFVLGQRRSLRRGAGRAVLSTIHPWG